MKSASECIGSLFRFGRLSLLLAILATKKMVGVAQIYGYLNSRFNGSCRFVFRLINASESEMDTRRFSHTISKIVSSPVSGPLSFFEGRGSCGIPRPRLEATIQIRLHLSSSSSFSFSSSLTVAPNWATIKGLPNAINRLRQTSSRPLP